MDASWQVKAIVAVLGILLIGACMYAYIEHRSLITVRADLLATRATDEDNLKQEYDALVAAKADNDSFVTALAAEHAKNDA